MFEKYLTESITTSIFSEYVNTVHQHDDSNVDLIEILNDVVIIEAENVMKISNDSVYHLT